MPKQTQISVALMNELGALCRLCGILARAEVNVGGMSIDDCTDEGFIRLIVDDPKKARKVLDQAKIPHHEQEVLLLDLANEPGMLQRVSAKLAEARINIHYAYGTADLRGRGGWLVLRVSDLDRAVQVLEGPEA